MSRLLSLGVLSVVVATATAQQFVLPTQGATGDTSYSVNVFRADQSHLQTVYDSSQFTSVGQFSPIQIDGIEWRQAAGTIGAALSYPIEV
jgi:hypothetical protein